MMDPFLIVCGAVKYPCATQEQLDQKLHQLAVMGAAKEVHVYRRETVELKNYKAKKA